jgi:hypothetical protein
MVMFAVTLLACAGVYAALRNMPVLSGCRFYAECPDDVVQTEVPTVAMDAGTATSP